MERHDIRNGQFYIGDCFDVMATLPDASVDMILCDLPYGTTACAWDSVLPFEQLWREYRRIAKLGSPIVLIASQPFTTALIASNMREFKYCWVWDKKAAGNAGLAKHQPLKIHEDIAVFSAAGGRAKYYPQMIKGKLRIKGGKASSGETQSGGLSGYQYESDQYYPKSILEFTNAGRVGRLHPTQKPVALFEYLIQTYTDPCMTVLDNTAGSGTTAIAAENAGRKWICIERDEGYAAKAIARIRDHATLL